MKLTKRKGFNFFRSYYDVYNELNNEDKLSFIQALLDRQFLGLKPKDLKGMAKFAWISQVNSIDSQVKGYEDKTKTRLNGEAYIKEGKPTDKPLASPPTDGGNLTPTQQVEEKEEEEVTIINNKPFLNSCLKDAQWMEVQSMQTRTNQDTIKKYLNTFEGKLIQTGEQKENIKEFKEHFTNWLNLQEIIKVIPKQKPIRYV
jgi:hypothetical protein